LTVDDLPQALQYYERVLGFQTDWIHGSPPALASVSRDAVELNLRQQEQGSGRMSSRLYFQIADVDSLFSRVCSCGAQVNGPLADQAYGMRDFSIVDPSGNERGFGQSIVQ
jgi:uncharacterized glyoxalase superfamily protein PhnB